MSFVLRWLNEIARAVADYRSLVRTRQILNFAPLLALVAACRTGAAVGGGAAYIEQNPSGTIARQGTWLPTTNVALTVRVRCEGEGVSRACRVEIARRDDPTAPLLASEPCGMAVPYPGVDSDRTVLVLVGEDGRGGWRQAARYVAERSAIVWTRRRYDDGL